MPLVEIVGKLLFLLAGQTHVFGHRSGRRGLVAGRMGLKVEGQQSDRKWLKGVEQKPID
jgi:hypothetical protein